MSPPLTHPQNASLGPPGMIPITATNRSILSTYRRSDATFVISEAEKTELLPKIENEGSDIIVFNPGSRNIRIGFAKEPFPKIVTHVIARKVQAELLAEGEQVGIEMNPSVMDVHATQVDEKASDLLDNRANYIRRKPMPNATQQILNFNRNATASVIAGHNDAFGLEWTNVSHAPSFVVGKDAMYIHPSQNYERRYPLHKRHFNLEAYSSFHHLMTDLESILVGACESELSLKPSELASYSLSIVIPDSYHRIELKSWLQLAFNCGFKSALVVHESLASTFGSGLGSACVVDIGAEQTSIALVEDGFLLSDSKISLDYGADHLIPLFAAFLQEYDFPYRELSLMRPADYDLLTELKERTCTLDEADVSIQVIDFYVRRPGQPTLSYQFKSSDERFLTPLALFHPHWLCLKEPFAWNEAFGEDPEAVVFKGSSLTTKPKTAEAADEQEETVEADETSFVVVGANASANPAVDTTLAPCETIQTLCCVWRDANGVSCSQADLEVHALMEHVLTEHFGITAQQQQLPSPTPVTCRWSSKGDAVCERPLAHVLATESHLMCHFVEDLAAAKISPVSKDQDMKDPYEYMGLDEAILKSITSVESDVDRIKRWLGSILLVGGGPLFPGFKVMLEEKLRDRAKAYVTLEDRVGAVSNTREVDPRHLSWKGGCIMARLEGAKEFWITSKEWKTIGMRSFIDKHPHLNL